jgi:hypothetical protein
MDNQYGPDTDKVLQAYLEQKDNKQLVIEDLDIHSLPPFPEGIKKLLIERIKITSLPPLPQSLKDLGIYNTEITSLPELPEGLEEIYCIENEKLSSLPPLPQSLKRLYCEDSQLTSLPALPRNLFTLSCEYSPQLTTITLPCPRELSRKNAFDVFYNCPNLRIQPYKNETCDDFFRRFPLPKVKVPKGQTDVISLEEIKDGTRMVDFDGEKERNRYYTEKTFEKLRDINPFTRQSIVKPMYYTAELDESLPVQEAGRKKNFRRKTFRKRNKKTRKYRLKRI